MWMLTTRGFFSAVAKGKEGMEVRARNEGDIKSLSALMDKPYRKGGGTDYPFRLDCTNEEWATACAALAREVDYRNFKDEVKKKQGPARASVYSSIWGTLLKLTPKNQQQPLYYEDTRLAPDVCRSCRGIVPGGDDQYPPCDVCNRTGKRTVPPSPPANRNRPAGTKTKPKSMTKKGR